MAITAFAIFIRQALAFEFPIPWTDEAAFLAQAFALSHSGTLFVPALNPDRLLMWMPPGYMIFLAVVFKLFGYSFGAARWVSAALYVMTYAMIIEVVRETLRGWRAVFALLLTLAVAMTPYVVVLCNIARMEALYNLAIVLSLYAALRNRPAIGLAIVLATGTVHFNAVYFLPLYAGITAHAMLARRVPRLVRSDLAALILGFLVVFAYCTFALLNWHGFVADISWQFRIRSGIPFRATPQDIGFLGLLLILPLLQIMLERKLTQELILSVYGAGFFLLSFHGDEMWYRFAFSEGLLLTGFSVLLSWQRHMEAPRRVQVGLANGCLLLLITWGIGYYAYTLTPATAPYPELLAQRVISKGEIKKIAAQIRALPKGSTVSFGFGFNGMEPFFFNDLAISQTTWTIHAHSATQLDPQRQADYRVRCDSALYKSFMVPKADGDFPRFGVNSGCALFRWHKTN